MKPLTPLTPTQVVEKNTSTAKSISTWKFIQKILLYASFIFFLLFLFEVLFLNINSLSFRGYYTERYFFYLYFFLGLFSLRKLFFWGFLSFIILSMIPMMIPFLMLLNWLGANDKQYQANEAIRAQEFHRFGQHNGDLIFFEKNNFFSEKIIFQFNIGICSIDHLSQISDVSLKSKIIKIEHEVHQDFIIQNVNNSNKENETCFCEIDLNLGSITTSLDSISYPIKKEGSNIYIDWEKVKKSPI
jgi:hypothetical protein